MHDFIMQYQKIFRFLSAIILFTIDSVYGQRYAYYRTYSYYYYYRPLTRYYSYSTYYNPSRYYYYSTYYGYSYNSNTGGIVGGIMGGVFLLIIVVVLSVYCCGHRGRSTSGTTISAISATNTGFPHTASNYPVTTFNPPEEYSYDQPPVYDLPTTAHIGFGNIDSAEVTPK